MSEEKKKKKHQTKGVCSKSCLLLSSSTSTDDEDGDFAGFSGGSNSSDEKLSCYECGDISVATGTQTYYNVQQLKMMGLRWHCPTCLKSPQGKSLKQDLNDFKISMKEELLQVKNCFNSELLRFQSSMVPSLVNNPPKSHKPLLKSKPSMTDKTTHQVIVSTDPNTPFTPATFAEKVKNNLSNVPIQRIQVNKNGQGIINFPDQSSRDNGLNQLKDDFQVVANNRPQRTLLPKITIKDIVSSDYAGADSSMRLRSAICDKNPAINALIEQGKMFEILFIKKDFRRENSSIDVAKIDEDIRKVIHSMNYQLFIDFSRCRVSDRFHVTQCYKCQKFGHAKNSCRSQTQTCRYCSENHESKTCPLNGNIAKYKCGNCGLNHSTTYAGCSVLQNQVISLASRTQGMDNF